MLSFHYEETIPILQQLADLISQKIILSTIDQAKPAQQIALENGLPLSSTYKKIRKLCDMKLLSIDKIEIDSSGKKVFFYKSMVRSCQFYLRQEGATLQFEKNEAPRMVEGRRTTQNINHLASAVLNLENQGL
jgi:DNA replication protein DnaD